MKTILTKSWKEVSLLTIIWLPATVLGNPFYNVVAYLIVDGIGYSEYVSTNVTQINVVMYSMIVVLIFLIRYIAYRLYYLSKSQYQMNTPYFIEVFSQRHQWQVISVLTFFMWAGEVEGNIAGFIYFPLTIVMLLSVSVVTLVRLMHLDKYLDKKMSS